MLLTFFLMDSRVLKKSFCKIVIVISTIDVGTNPNIVDLYSFLGQALMLHDSLQTLVFPL